jgi:lycopene epsilon-cyclase
MPMSSTRVFFEVGTEISLRSYIPVGGSLPNTDQKNLAFGAAASIVHPATGTKRFINFLHASFLLAYIDDVSQNT